MPKALLELVFLWVLVAYIKCLTLQQKEEFIILKMTMNFSTENNITLYVIHTLL